MCKLSGETTDHLLLHCDRVWLMVNGVAFLACNRSCWEGLWSCWSGGLGKTLCCWCIAPCRIVFCFCGPFWGREPLYFWWGWAFILELKFHLLHTMFVWFAAFSGHSFSSLKEFLDFCKFNRLSLKHFLCTWGSFSFSS